MALAPGARRAFINAMRQGWQRLRPPTTLLQSIRRYYLGTTALPATPFHVTEHATRTERTATRRAGWDEIRSCHAEALAFDRHRPPLVDLGRAVERLTQGRGEGGPAGEGWLPPAPAPLRPS